MRILALDQSSKVSGYCVFEFDELVTYGKITCSSPVVGARLKKIRDNIKNLVEEYKIDEVIFEDIQLQKNVANNVVTYKVLSEVFGVITELLEELKIPYETVLAGTWKSALGIKGRTRAEQKKSASEFVKAQFDITPTQDEADSICIGLYKLKQLSTDWTK